MSKKCEWHTHGKQSFTILCIGVRLIAGLLRVLSKMLALKPDVVCKNIMHVTWLIKHLYCVQSKLEQRQGAGVLHSLMLYWCHTFCVDSRLAGASMQVIVYTIESKIWRRYSGS